VSRGAAIVDMRTDQRIKRHPHEELRVELAEEFERFADALAGFASVAHQGCDRCCATLARSSATTPTMSRSCAAAVRLGAVRTYG
jgi:hypothetical protein